MRKSETGKWSKWMGGALTLFAGVALTALASQPAAAQGKQLTLCWAAWDPANALVELGKDFTKEFRHRDEIRVRPVDELCRPLPQ